MKKVFRISVLVIALVTIMSIVGCSSGSKTVAPAKERAVSMMQMLPSNISGFTFFDKYALTTDKNLSAVWSDLNENYFGFGNDSLSNSINSLCFVYPNDIVMYEGDFTLDQFMGSTANGSYNYGGFNVRYGAYNSSIVLINGTAITGDDEDVRSCIDIANGNESSFYENDNVKAIVDNLTVGYEMDLGYVDNESAFENISGLQLVGASWAKSGDNDTGTDIYQFNTSDAAQQYVANASNVSDDGTMSIARTQDGAFVTEVLTPLTSTPAPTETPALTPEPTATPAQ